METKEWYAWVNLMPPGPDDFHVTGQVHVGNPGVEPQLLYREPQGIVAEELLLGLHLFQQAGMWPQVETWVEARYDKTLSPDSTHYTKVKIFYEDESIAEIDVDEAH